MYISAYVYIYVHKYMLSTSKNSLLSRKKMAIQRPLYMYVYTYISQCIYMNICIHASKHTYKHTYIYKYTYLCIYVRLNTYNACTFLTGGFGLGGTDGAITTPTDMYTYEYIHI
jgi:hypothetical protein